MRERGAVIFDLDGTLTVPYLDFKNIAAEIGVDGPILEAMRSMDTRSRRRAERILSRYEHEAAENVVMQSDAADVVKACRSDGRPVAILTRNSRTTTDIVLARSGITVDAVRTRDDGEIKPSPLPVLSICSELQANPRESWMVGDYLFDILSGEGAGTSTVLMVGDKPAPEYAAKADHVIRRLRDLLPIIGVDGTAT